jgi:hypothetical protein
MFSAAASSVRQALGCILMAVMLLVLCAGAAQGILKTEGGTLLNLALNQKGFKL